MSTGSLASRCRSRCPTLLVLVDVGAHHVVAAAISDAHLARRFAWYQHGQRDQGVIAYATIKSDSPRRDGNILTTISPRPFSPVSLCLSLRDTLLPAASMCRK